MDVNEVIRGDCHPARALQESVSTSGQRRRPILGRTCGDRYLVVVVEPKSKGVVRPITAFDMPARQIVKYEAWRKTVRK